MEIQLADRLRVPVDVAIELPLGVAAKRFIDQGEDNPNRQDEDDDNDDGRSENSAHEVTVRENDMADDLFRSAIVYLGAIRHCQ